MLFFTLVGRTGSTGMYIREAFFQGYTDEILIIALHEQILQGGCKAGLYCILPPFCSVL